jgi:hypothetical protein
VKPFQVGATVSTMTDDVALAGPASLFPARSVAWDSKYHVPSPLTVQLIVCGLVIVEADDAEPTVPQAVNPLVELELTKTVTELTPEIASEKLTVTGIVVLVLYVATEVDDDGAVASYVIVWVSVPDPFGRRLEHV